MLLLGKVYKVRKNEELGKKKELVVLDAAFTEADAATCSSPFVFMLSRTSIAPLLSLSLSLSCVDEEVISKRVLVQTASVSSDVFIIRPGSSVCLKQVYLHERKKAIQEGKGKKRERNKVGGLDAAKGSWYQRRP
jgi:hypothetical protein